MEDRFLAAAGKRPSKSRRSLDTVSLPGDNDYAIQRSEHMPYVRWRPYRLYGREQRE